MGLWQIQPSLLLLILPTISAIILTDFQPINGFSSQCTQAYNTPLQGCTQSDFQNGHTCSPTCITFLEALTKMLNTDCKGTSAFPNTLIGLFFSQQGTSTLCPNVLGSSGNDAGDQASYSSAASPSTSADSQQQSSMVVSSTSDPTTSTYSEASSTSIPSPSDNVSTSSTVVVIQTTVSPTSVPSSIASSTSSHSSKAHSSRTSSASEASNTATEANNGGGTILDLGSTNAASPSLDIKSCLWPLLGVYIVLDWLL